MTLLITGYGLLLIAKFSSAKYLLVDIGDDVDHGFGTIDGNGLDLSETAKTLKGNPEYPFSLTEQGHICSDEGMKDLPDAATCKYAAKIMMMGQFEEIQGFVPTVPTKCFYAPVADPHLTWKVFWNPNTTGKRNQYVQAICWGY